MDRDSAPLRKARDTPLASCILGSAVVWATPRGGSTGRGGRRLACPASWTRYPCEKVQARGARGADDASPWPHKRESTLRRTQGAKGSAVPSSFLESPNALQSQAVSRIGGGRPAPARAP